MLSNEITTKALELMPAIRGMFAKMGLRQDQIEDATQDGFVFLVTYCLPKWNGKGSVYTFAITAVKRRWFDSVDLHANRDDKRTTFPSESEYGDKNSDLIADHRQADLREAVEESEWLANALLFLSDRDRAILAAVQRNDGNWGAAANELGISPATASRARTRIRAAIESRRLADAMGEE